MKNAITRSIVILMLSYIFFSLCLIKIAGNLILTPAFFHQDGKEFGDDPGTVVELYLKINRWLYVFTALYLILKFLVISIVLKTGFYLFRCSASFKTVFRATVLAEFIFLIPAMIKIYWYPKAFPDGGMNEWAHFYPLSAMSLLNYRGTIWVYPLQSLNFFEVLYWFLLAYILSHNTSVSFDKTIKVVLSSYLPALIIWGVVIVFYTIIVLPSG
ncbi:hypothetical protein [Mucilaginibacter gynuensis]|uniref:hypothetical protein n=1 Tax=Mucilaginibacter gynuensis TaxID=1302236 RepID=UPI0031EEB3E1